MYFFNALGWRKKCLLNELLIFKFNFETEENLDSGFTQNINAERFSN